MDADCSSFVVEPNGSYVNSMECEMNAPQIILVVLLAINFAMAAIWHGRKRNIAFQYHHVGYKALDIATLVGLLYWGGFFD